MSTVVRIFPSTIVKITNPFLLCHSTVGVASHILCMIDEAVVGVQSLSILVYSAKRELQPLTRPVSLEVMLISCRKVKT